VSVSPCGTWELRHTLHGEPPNLSTGYGMQQWDYELVLRATGATIASWSGSATSSPWDASSFGVANVSWDGEYLVIEHCAEHLHAHPVIERVLPATLTRK
jgi:hypothetical protein